MKRLGVGFLLTMMVLSTTLFAKTNDTAVYRAPKADIDAIIKEGMENSKVMSTLEYLTTVIGPRLTNSPGMREANRWTRDEMARWGMANAKIEPWGEFGRGWSLNEFSAHVVAPTYMPVIAYPKAWTPSTPGMVTGKVVHFAPKRGEDLSAYKGKMKGAIVLTSAVRNLKADFEGIARRFTDKQLLDFANAPDPKLMGRPGRAPISEAQIQGFIAGQARNIEILNFLRSEGAAVMVDNSRKGDGGTVFVSGASAGGETPKTIEDIIGGNRLYKPGAEKDMIPQMTMSTEHYNHVLRLIKHGKDVQMSVNIKATYHDDDLMGYNTIAEIPGTDPKLKDEIVMVGAHLDSWHASGGATDNGAGSAVAMEAARIIMAADLKPRRTIRVALWDAEEQGLNGSREYVAKHFGKSSGGRFAALLGRSTEITKMPDYDKFSAYYNMDNGTGQFRGVYLQGNSKVAPIFRTWLQPFRKWGVTTLTINNTSGTDHLSFDAVGLPGFQFIQDPIEYSPLTHHSNQDSFDRIQEKDIKINATVMAAFVYQTAMMEEKIPRK